MIANIFCTDTPLDCTDCYLCYARSMLTMRVSRSRVFTPSAQTTRAQWTARTWKLEYKPFATSQMIWRIHRFRTLAYVFRGRGRYYNRRHYYYTDRATNDFRRNFQRVASSVLLTVFGDHNLPYNRSRPTDVDETFHARNRHARRARTDRHVNILHSCREHLPYHGIVSIRGFGVIVFK